MNEEKVVIVDKILLSNMAFEASHGVSPEERRVQRPFLVDVEISADLRQAGLSDELGHTICYANVWERVRHIMEGSAHHLLESLAENIAIELLKIKSVCEVLVRVKKPHAPVGGVVDYCGVEIRRPS